MNFLHRLFRHILQRVSLPQEEDWYSLNSFGCVYKEILIKEQFMVMKTFKYRALTAVQG